MIKGDSKDYNLLAKWVDELNPKDFYLTVEIGVREGYGSHVIMENLPKIKIAPFFGAHRNMSGYGCYFMSCSILKEGVVPRWTDFNGNILYNPDGSFKTPSVS